MTLSDTQVSRILDAVHAEKETDVDTIRACFMSGVRCINNQMDPDGTDVAEVEHLALADFEQWYDGLISRSANAGARAAVDVLENAVRERTKAYDIPCYAPEEIYALFDAMRDDLTERDESKAA